MYTSKKILQLLVKIYSNVSTTIISRCERCTPNIVWSVMWHFMSLWYLIYWHFFTKYVYMYVIDDEAWMKSMPLFEEFFEKGIFYILSILQWNIVMDDYNMDENSLSKWQWLQHWKSIMPSLFLHKEWKIRIVLVILHMRLQFVLSKANRLGDTK